MIGRVLFCCVIFFALSGCNRSNPGNWDQTRVEEHLKKKHVLVEISLAPGPDGGFAGSGKTKEGETYKFKVKQNAELKQLSWNFDSDRGDVGNEVYEFVNAQ